MDLDQDPEVFKTLDPDPHKINKNPQQLFWFGNFLFAPPDPHIINIHNILSCSDPIPDPEDKIMQKHVDQHSKNCLPAHFFQLPTLS